MFVCALRPRGETLSRADVFGYIARLKRTPDASLHTIAEGPFAAMASNGSDECRPQLGRWRQLTGAGDVRLDNPGELARLAGVKMADVASDLELVLAALDRLGEACIPRILGDFAFVVWDAHAQKLVAVRDAFGVRPLYHTQTADLVLFASEIGPLQRDNVIDTDFLLGFLTRGAGDTDRTVWSGIGSVAPGTFLRQRGTVRSRSVYWSAEAFSPRSDSNEDADRTRFRELLEEAVRTRMTGGREIWAQLSGGLDSSAVVAVASTLGTPGLSGTITLVDSLGEGDERAYSGAMVKRYHLRNEQVRDYWAWQDDGEAPPLTDQPGPMYPFFARERRIGRILRDNRATTLLTGVGADHYLYGTLDYITDLASSGQVGAALNELTTWSVATRQSFWRLGNRYLVQPFLPRMLQPAAEPPPQWLSATALQPAGRGLGSAPRSGAQTHAQRPAGASRFASSIVEGLAALPAWMDSAPFGADIELRHPFLYRPLVEWSMRLPPRQRIRPHARKWILREAARDLLPDNIRTRSTKGGIDGRILWSLHHERKRLDALLCDPILAQLGCIDGAQLRLAVEQARCGLPVHNVHLFSALSLETWLAVRAGQWDVAPKTTAVETAQPRGA